MNKVDGIRVSDSANADIDRPYVGCLHLIMREVPGQQQGLISLRHPWFKSHRLLQFHQMQIASHFIGVDDLESAFDVNMYIKSRFEADRNYRAF